MALKALAAQSGSAPGLAGVRRRRGAASGAMSCRACQSDGKKTLEEKHGKEGQTDTNSDTELYNTAATIRIDKLVRTERWMVQAASGLPTAPE
jgi:copper chaperone CopZ